MYEKSDVFPKQKAASVERLRDYPHFGSLIGQKTVRHFCLYMEDCKIYFQKRNLSQSVINTFGQHGKEAKAFNQFRPNEINWSVVINKFKRVPVESNRKNADVRVGFKIGSDYLVKAHFTFGQRIVEPRTAHVIQTLNVPLLFFLRLPENRRIKTERCEKAFFPYKTLCYYDRRILEPSKCYRIPPGTVYVLFSTQKNYFRVNVVEEDYQIPFEYVDPVKVRVTKMEGMYDLPVKTPYIEDEVSEEEDSEMPSSTEMLESSSTHFEIPAQQKLRHISYHELLSLGFQ